MERKVVKAVRRVDSQPDAVYNLRIKNNHNYFVNGVLTHNCDDPHDPEQASNEQDRKMAIDYWTNKISTRGWVRGVKRAIVAQRLHEEDLSGYVLANTKGVTHLCMPMEFEVSRKCKTNIKYLNCNWEDSDNMDYRQVDGWEDPRTVEGELLWPQGANQEKVDELKSNMRRAHAIAGQLQQRRRVQRF